MLALTQPLPGLVKDRLDAVVALFKVAGIAGQKSEAAPDLVRNVTAGQRLAPCGREFQRQRHAAHQPADLDHGGEFLLRAEIRVDAARALVEQLHRIVVRAREPWPRTVGERQARHRIQPFLFEAQRFARGDQVLDSGCCRQEERQLIRGTRQVLEVVEDNERLPGLEVPAELLEGRL